MGDPAWLQLHVRWQNVTPPAGKNRYTRQVSALVQATIAVRIPRGCHIIRRHSKEARARYVRCDMASDVPCVITLKRQMLHCLHPPPGAASIETTAVRFMRVANMFGYAQCCSTVAGMSYGQEGSENAKEHESTWKGRVQESQNAREKRGRESAGVSACSAIRECYEKAHARKRRQGIWAVGSAWILDPDI